MRNNKILQLNTFLGNKEERFHFARVTIHQPSDLRLHQHSFAEIFWIESGSGHHFINGKKKSLQMGTMVFVRPQDKHTFGSDGNKHGITIANLAFEPDTIEHLYNRYFQGSQEYFWTNNHLPFQIELSTEQVFQLATQADKLQYCSKTVFDLDRFLLKLFDIILPKFQNNSISDLPSWLHVALEHTRTPKGFHQDIQEICKLTGRSADYINRLLKEKTGFTFTQTINKFRLQYAGNQLMMSEVAIKTICSECGFANLGYFYKIFSAYYGQTPNEYRQKNRTIV